MSDNAANVQANEGFNSGFTPGPDPNSLAAAQAKAGVTQGNDRPSWLPENFKTADDFVKGYNELRADHTRKSQELAGLKKANDGKPADNKAADDDKAKQALTDAGVPQESINKWSESFWQTGEVPAEAYTELAKVGITKEIIDDYAKSKSALVEGQRTALLNAGGGEQNVQTMFNWAAKNLKPAEIAQYNTAFDSGDFNASMMAMESLKARYEQTEGRAPNLVSGNVLPTSNSGAVYTSAQQVQQDMSDPRYAMDPSFRKAVEQKLARSKVL